MSNSKPTPEARWRSAVGVLAVSISFAAVFVTAVSFRARTSQMSSRVDRLTEELRNSQLLARHLGYHVKQQGFDGLFLKGTDAITDTAYTIPKVRDGVYFLMSAECPWTPRNYSYLASIAEAGIQVVGLALRDDAVVLKRHLQSAAVPYPVIVNPSGALLRALPSLGPSFLAVVRDGRFSLLKAGLLDSADVADILYVTATSPRGS